MVEIRTFENIEKNGKYILGSKKPIVGKINKITVYMEKFSPETCVNFTSNELEDLGTSYLTSNITRFLPLDYNNNFPNSPIPFIVDGVIFLDVGGLPEDRVIDYVKIYLE